MTNLDRAILSNLNESKYQELAESFINGNISYVRGKVGNKYTFIGVLKIIKEYYPKEEESFIRLMSL